jgi:hypothetical protein
MTSAQPESSNFCHQKRIIFYYLPWIKPKQQNRHGIHGYMDSNEPFSNFNQIKELPATVACTWECAEEGPAEVTSSLPSGWRLFGPENTHTKIQIYKINIHQI